MATAAVEQRHGQQHDRRAGAARWPGRCRRASCPGLRRTPGRPRCCRCSGACRARPWVGRSYRTCRRSWRGRPDRTSTSGAGEPSSRESNDTMSGGSGPSVLRSSRRVPTTVTPESASGWPARRSRRSPSAISTVGVAVLQREREFRTVPERVERHGDRTGQRRREERDRPLGHVAHRDGDAVAGADPEAVDEGRRQRRDPVRVLGMGQPLVAEDQERAVGAQRAAAREQVSDRARRTGPDAHRATVHLDLLDLERCSRRGQFRVDLANAQAWPHGRNLSTRPALATNWEITSYRLRSKTWTAASSSPLAHAAS